MPPILDQHRIKHIGLWVQDVAEAVDRWVTVYGAGPFFYVSSTSSEATFRGERISMREDAAYGKLGNTAVVLSKATFDAPLPELERLLRIDSSTPNKVGFFSYLADDPAEESARLEGLGYPLFFTMGNGPVATYWHDTWDDLGHIVEITGAADAVRQFISVVDRAADGWDGTNPLRTQLPDDIESDWGDVLNARGESGTSEH